MVKKNRSDRGGKIPIPAILNTHRLYLQPQSKSYHPNNSPPEHNLSSTEPANPYLPTQLSFKYTTPQKATATTTTTTKTPQTPIPIRKEKKKEKIPEAPPQKCRPNDPSSSTTSSPHSGHIPSSKRHQRYQHPQYQQAAHHQA